MVRPIALALLAAVSCTQAALGPVTPGTVRAATVVRHIDGDTFAVDLDGVQESIRFIGIDTPERGAPGFDEASRFTARAAPIGSRVSLVFDVEQRDRYGRLLAYVWLRPPPEEIGAEDVRTGTLNARLVSAGWARTLTIPPNVAWADLFADLQREARAAARGLWAT